MILLNKDFVKPSKEARYLSILDSLAKDSGLSQQELGRRARLSGTMVNQYLKEMNSRELVRFEPLNGKSFTYPLTEKGQEMRRQMFSSYSSEIVRMYSALKDTILDTLEPLRQRGVTALALFGASETCEVVLSAIAGTEFSVVAVLDNDPEKHGSMFHGYVISPPQVLESIRCQAIVITSFGRHNEIYAQLEPVSKQRGVEVVRL